VLRTHIFTGTLYARANARKRTHAAFPHRVELPCWQARVSQGRGSLLWAR